MITFLSQWPHNCSASCSWCGLPSL